MFRIALSQGRSQHRHPGVGAVILWLMFVLPLLAGSGAVGGAELPHILILLSEPGGAYSEVATTLQRRFDRLAADAAVLDIQPLPESPAALDALFATRPALVAPIGIRATAVALQHAGTLPVLALLVPQNDYEALLGSREKASPLRSAIYLDQPLERQLDLLQLVVPDRTRLSVLAGPQSADDVERLDTLTELRGLSLTRASVPPGGNPIVSLSRVIDDADVLLALPDPDVFNRGSLQAILLTTYHNFVPVIGFSRAYVRAGALAAVYSSAGQIGEQAGDWLADLARGDRWTLGAPEYPVYFSVAVNIQVAQSLGIAVPDEAQLTEQLRKLQTRGP